MRLVILAFIRYYLPGYKSGGPVRSISNMVESLGDEFEFRVVTSDRDMLDKKPYTGIKIGSWNHVGKAWVYYVPHGKAGFREWVRIIKETPHDILYLNSLFDPVYAFLPLLVKKIINVPNQPLVIAPRGELSPGALALKRWKKQPYLAITNAVGLYRDILWHASTEEELLLIRQQFGKMTNSLIACNLPATNIQLPQPSTPEDPKKTLRILFLSRIAKKKNLLYALRVLMQSKVKVHFDIWGSLEDKKYWQECQRLIESMPEHISVAYKGVAEHSLVPAIMADYDLFFLPTCGENYGHVVAEAISAGTPVLLSDQTPWRGLYDKGVGWDLPLAGNESGFAEALESAAKKIKENKSMWRRQVYEYAAEQLNDATILEANRQLFYQAMKVKGR